MSCVNPKRKSFESKNTFEILQNQNDDEDDAEQPSPKLTVNLLDVLKRQSKHNVKNKKVRFLKPSHCACCSDTFEDFPQLVTPTKSEIGKTSKENIPGANKELLDFVQMKWKC